MKYLTCKVITAALLVAFSLSCRQGGEEVAPGLLVVTPVGESYRFGPYLEEILVAEGFRDFEMREDLPQRMSDYTLVIVTPHSWSSDQARTLADYVEQGGRLIAFRPGNELSAQFNLNKVAEVPEGHWKPLEGQLAPLPLQYKGSATIWQTGDEHRTRAELMDSSSLSVPGPAAIAVGRGSGEALFFAFDPILSIIHLRQGDPESANQERDEVDGIRPHEMMWDFWDPKLVRLPQTDILQRYLADSIRELVGFPLPTVWYLPGKDKAIVIMTGDAHNEESLVIEQMLSDVEGFGGTASIYLLPPVGEKWSRDQVEAWQARGHEISVHPDHEGTREHSRENRWAHLEEAVEDFSNAYGQPVRTVRNDWVIWYGWVEQARMQRQLGIEMDLNFVSSQPTHFGYMFGSGLPMRFVDEKGSVLDHFQQPTQFEDDTVMDPSAPWSLNLTDDEATAETTGLLERSLQGDFNALCLNIHPLNYLRYSGEWTRRTLRYAQENGIPIWNARKWLDFIRARNGVEIRDLRCRAGSCSFRVAQMTPVEGVGLIVPGKFGDQELKSVRRGREEVSIEQVNIRGRPFSIVTLEPKSEQEWTLLYE